MMQIIPLTGQYPISIETSQWSNLVDGAASNFLQSPEAQDRVIIWSLKVLQFKVIEGTLRTNKAYIIQVEAKMKNIFHFQGGDLIIEGQSRDRLPSMILDEILSIYHRTRDYCEGARAIVSEASMETLTCGAITEMAHTMIAKLPPNEWEPAFYAALLRGRE